MQIITSSHRPGIGAVNPPKAVSRRVLSRRVSAYSPQPTVVVDPTAFPASELAELIAGYLKTSSVANHSETTLVKKKAVLSYLTWLAERREWETIDSARMMDFFVYVREGYKEPGGRWGNPQQTKPVQSSTIRTYHTTLKAFFRWLVRRGVVAVAATDTIDLPRDKSAQIRPFEASHITALYAAAGRSAYPLRDQAILLTLLDTGLRSSELCALTHADVDTRRGRISVRHGKGDKPRVVPLSPDAENAITVYRGELSGYEAGDALFVAERGRDTGCGLTRSGLQQLFGRLEVAARLPSGVVRCSPHTCRHTFAVTYLRAKDRGGYGGDVLTLQTIMGHESPNVLRRYVLLADADLADKHDRFSILKSVKAIRSNAARRK